MEKSKTLSERKKKTKTEYFLSLTLQFAFAPSSYCKRTIAPTLPLRAISQRLAAAETEG
jgi:hypothetical protein